MGAGGKPNGEESLTLANPINENDSEESCWSQISERLVVFFSTLPAHLLLANLLSPLTLPKLCQFCGHEVQGDQMVINSWSRKWLSRHAAGQ